MSRCTKWVDEGVIECKAWANELSATCTLWADEGSDQCKTWADQGNSQCSQWADEGSNQCQQWADEGSNQCQSWADEGSNQCSSSFYNECHWYSPWNCVIGWFCQAWYWVANWVCQGWYWVANWVCKAWYWVANWVCKAWYWVAKWVCVVWYWVAKWVCKGWAWFIKAVCTVWSWVAKLVCVAWQNAVCLVTRIIRAVLFVLGVRRQPAIRHVFVLMLENRSFDHMLGFSGITGRDAVTSATTSIDGLVGNPHSNIDPGTGTPVQAAPPADFKVADEDKDPPHEFCDVLKQLSGKGQEGKTCGDAFPDSATGGYPPINNSGFVTAYRDKGSAHPEKIMNCYSPEQLPVLTTLAREFAVCDRWFSSMPGPTWPNRFFLHAASSGGLDDSPSPFVSATSTLLDGYRFWNGTIFDRLEDRCLDWEIFEGDEFPQVFAISGMDLYALEGKFTDFEDFADRLSEKDYSPFYVFIEPSYGNVLPTTSEDFTCGNSQHPLDDVTRGERLIKQVYETIRNSPLWDKSLLIITYDEHGGFYDHVAPPAATAPGDPISDEDNNHHDFKFDQLGVRVPAVIVSPLIPRGTIDHTVYDHTSVLATVERLFGLKPLTKRDAAANDFLHLFSLSTPRGDAPATLPEPAESGYHCT